MDDFLPTASWDALHLRARLLEAIRGFFRARNFLEVDTPLLSHDTVVDRHLDPVPVTVAKDPTSSTEGERMWLQTSPEFAMKRLLAAGAQRIFQITRAFRAAERGALHNPEFTIVEWYRVGDSYDRGRQLLADLTSHVSGLDEIEQLTYADAFDRWVGIDPHATSTDDLAGHVQRLEIPVPLGMSHEDRDSWLDLLFAERVQPHLGQKRPVILYDYPASQAALAKIRPDEPPVAERFELFWRGVELANGYHELTDPKELAERMRTSNRWRKRDGKPVLPETSRLLAAMAHGIPDCCGVALGFDRLVMLRAGAASIDHVLPFPFERA